jgi:hypothetical protein
MLPIQSPNTPQHHPSMLDDSFSATDDAQLEVLPHGDIRDHFSKVRKEWAKALVELPYLPSIHALRMSFEEGLAFVTDSMVGSFVKDLTDMLWEELGKGIVEQDVKVVIEGCGGKE